ncbi:hypothetical protein DY000_02004895 [Brassica cretica]|uniref:Uncharacterized protein n=1 Tax=Brassica cretica TaxID=69181 RepID=A0ABQ7C2B0_BRACR|nr:hypothetical protein DY000_02004895 [Brassica cretica]
MKFTYTQPRTLKSRGRALSAQGLEEEDERGWWDEKVVDDFFKDDMPDWMTEDELTGSDKLQYYEMEEDAEWLHLYAEFVLYSKRLQPE